MKQLSHSVWTNQSAAGMLPAIILEGTDETAKEQLNVRYAHGGGFKPFGQGKWNLEFREAGAALHYPQDDAMQELSRTTVRHETLILFEASWLAIVQPNGSFEVTRVD